MNDRKQRVVKMAYQLFIDKGFQATSIQDILDYSGISKGTFYNYFSSKNELMKAIFKMTYSELEKQRNDLLIGQDRSDIEIFIKQIEMQLNTNRKSKLITLFQEVLVSNDADLKQFIEKGQLNFIRWIYQRLIEIFGDNKKPYLLDCAIMFMGILRENIKYFQMANDSNTNIGAVVRYSVRRLVNMAAELEEADEQLIQPQTLDKWLPDCKRVDQAFQKKLHHSIFLMKNSIQQHDEQSKYVDLLDFIEEELVDSKGPRKFLIESALLSLKAIRDTVWEKGLNQLEQLVEDFFITEEEN